MDDLPSVVVYGAAGLGALFLCVLVHLLVRLWQGRTRSGGRAKKTESLEVDVIIEQLTLLAADVDAGGRRAETDAVLQRVTEFSLQHLEVAEPLGGHLSAVRRARNPEEAGSKLRELLQWMKANRAVLSRTPEN